MEHLIWNIDPVLISFGAIKIHWYGVLFSAAILSGLQVMKWIYKTENIELGTLDTLLGYVVVGIIVGARLGHCFFYDPSYYFANPMKILAIWEGGLASHGGGLGVILAIGLYVKKYKVSYLWILDRLAIGTALFGVFVRFANFINSEILGVQTNVPWAVVFARVDNVPRHPAQLYEAFAYLFIFIILIGLYKKFKSKSPNGLLLGIFLILAFTARFLIESVKQKQAAYSSEFILNTGQMLSIPFFIAGIVLVILALKQLKQPSTISNKK
ncbi:prolipoprotein diacylglyceryl transferase [Pseudocolwellia sp. AS88]|uniref:prolipoprotein diacylglyceryl transferase n=1 Tax=Pseudocolwellia sp. AS88 TaxID=3063958 RepID=UPI0026F0E2C8|nr:prolipoprotein diacylglyceryl transferase [Pseudocolwellia sp. AS88]MDO7086441.1 prolipoprotein diacylglyceryl transferase [Pseudocolwellia sp. AS88]